MRGKLLLGMPAVVGLAVYWCWPSVATPNGQGPAAALEGGSSQATGPRRPQALNARTQPPAANFDETLSAIPGAAPRPADSEARRPEDGPMRSEDVREVMDQAPEPMSTPGQRARAREERNREVGKLEESGSDHGRWERQLRGVRAELEQMIRRIDFDASVADLKCYQAGCYLTVLSANERAANAFSTNLQRSGSASEWYGGAFVSGIIETDSAQVETTVIFFAPEDQAKIEG